MLRKAETTKAMRVVVSQRQELWYAGGADVALDRPAHVRAASGLAAVNGKIVICQDDADFLAVLDPVTQTIEALPLPSKNGVRLYSEAQGNKPDKADLESCLYLPEDDLLLAFGSGSTDRRFRIAAAQGWRSGPPRLWWIDATPLYRQLMSNPEFSGSELNIEGVVRGGETIRFFQRGNGAPKNGLAPVNATIDLALPELLQFIRDPASTLRLENVVRYDLSSIGEVPYTFTDACAVGEDIYFLAAAEDSPDTFRDGPLCAMALGRIQANGDTTLAIIHDEAGRPFAEKAEGLLFDPGSTTSGCIAIDHDDPTIPATLWRFRIEEA